MINEKQSKALIICIFLIYDFSFLVPNPNIIRAGRAQANCESFTI